MGLQICNGYTSLVSTAIMFYSPETCHGEGDNFQMMGWWNLDPGTCARVYDNDLGDLNPLWYYFAHAQDGSFWAGPVDATVPLAPFNQCLGAGVGGATSESGSIGFRELDIGNSSNVTLIIT